LTAATEGVSFQINGRIIKLQVSELPWNSCLAGLGNPYCYGTRKYVAVSMSLLH